jgi:hypothetical protein
VLSNKLIPDVDTNNGFRLKVTCETNNHKTIKLIDFKLYSVVLITIVIIPTLCTN